MALARRLCFVFIGILLLQYLAFVAHQKWLPETAEVGREVLLFVTFLLVPPIAYCLALHGRPSASGQTIKIGRAIWLAAGAFAFSIGTLLGSLLVHVLLDIVFGIPARLPP